VKIDPMRKKDPMKGARMRAHAIRWGLPLLLAAVLGVGASMAATASLQSSGGTVKVMKSSKYGTVLVSSTGLTLYRFALDKKGVSVCGAGCVKLWPPYLVKGKAKPTVGTGASASLLGTIKRSNGALQISYARFPLYTYSGDKKPGAMTGEGFQNYWYAVSVTGALVKHAVAGSGGQTTTAKKKAWG
jgi:predicted lipoprotein with Yx(FWY)xxD motif